MATTNKSVASAKADEYHEAKTANVLSAGTAFELEARGFAVSPFTSALLVGTPDNYREVGQEEYTRVAREYAKSLQTKKESKLL